jgi:hypothetical protein
MNELSLIQTISLDKYIVKIYSINTATANDIAEANMSYMQNDLNSQEYPKEIVDLLEKFDEFTRIEVYDKDNNLLISSGVLFPSDN